MADPSGASDACPRCGAPLERSIVRATFWQDDRLVVVEDVPAGVCKTCVEQFYDDDVSDALRRLAEDRFPERLAVREQVVPVFSLKGRVRRRRVLPEGTYVD